VTVPEGAEVGSSIVFTAPNGVHTIMTEVPPGTKPGQKLEVELPTDAILPVEAAPEAAEVEHLLMTLPNDVKPGQKVIAELPTELQEKVREANSTGQVGRARKERVWKGIDVKKTQLKQLINENNMLAEQAAAMTSTFEGRLREQAVALMEEQQRRKALELTLLLQKQLRSAEAKPGQRRELEQLKAQVEKMQRETERIATLNAGLVSQLDDVNTQLDQGEQGRKKSGAKRKPR